MHKYSISLCTTLLLAVVWTAAQSDSGTVRDRYIALALQGDLSQAEALIGPPRAGTPDDDLAARYSARFVVQEEDLAPSTGDALADAVVTAYRDYWVATLTRQVSLPEGEAELKHALLKILPPPASPEPGREALGVFDRVSAELGQRGFRVLDTPAPPLRDLFLWRTEEHVRYTVRLTDLSQPVRVTFISDIYSQGWKEFATLGLMATTGWVEGEQLYCISSSYDRSSEDFRVSYLKHEARHLADYRQFPGLSSVELEYRAKLTELAFSTLSTRQLLRDFTLQGADNPNSPHALANYRVSRDMHLALYDAPLSSRAASWQGLDPPEVNRAARELLEINTRALSAEIE